MLGCSIISLKRLHNIPVFRDQVVTRRLDKSFNLIIPHIGLHVHFLILIAGGCAMCMHACEATDCIVLVLFLDNEFDMGWINAGIELLMEPCDKTSV